MSVFSFSELNFLGDRGAGGEEPSAENGQWGMAGPDRKEKISGGNSIWNLLSY
jgi:hypothetical protein